MSPTSIGRVAGALFWAAFPLFGGGAALGARAPGPALVLGNSVAVAAIGVMFHALFRARHPTAATAYLVGRTFEATVLAAVVTGASTVDQALPVAMVGLGVGSVPLYVALARGGEIPRWLGAFGALGYGALVVGEVLQLSGVPVGLGLSAPGGLFEVIFGGWLLAGQIGDGGGAR